ncbi:MAG TPA: amidohydrolase family protein [Thermoanaerobaculia bacterium]|nr:amidohydrolase family protein [Thermoanaerobaculia bacterium]
MHHRRRGLFFLLFITVAHTVTGGAATAQNLDLVLTGGRVMDPASGLDAERDVGIRDGRVVALSESRLAGRTTIDARGLVVAPGFIDLHAHGQDPVSNAFQAADGVTTALECETGVWPVARWIESRRGHAVVNYGATAGHMAARIKVIAGIDAGQRSTQTEAVRDRIAAMGPTPDWSHRAATDAEIEQMAALLRQGLDEGGLGLGFGLAYTPGATHSEIFRLFAVAAERGVPAFAHLRAQEDFHDQSALATVQEVIADAAGSGASLHIVHLNSTADREAQECLRMIRGARERGVDVTTESYPYTAGSTRIESARLDHWEEESGGRYDLLQWLETGERLTKETFEKYRKEGGWVILHGRSEEASEWLVAQPDVMVASDATPFVGGLSHPRSAGTFSRVLGHYARERQTLPLMQTLAKMTILPARRLVGVAPAMKRKGRIEVGADADLTVFDPATIIDRATYEAPAQTSAGVAFVLVGGVLVVRDGKAVEGVFPGQPVLGDR